MSSTFSPESDHFSIQGNYDQANEKRRQGLEILRDALGEGHPEYGTILSNLGRSLTVQVRILVGEGAFWVTAFSSAEPKST